MRAFRWANFTNRQTIDKTKDTGDEELRGVYFDRMIDI
jgi:hypothetical protein